MLPDFLVLGAARSGTTALHAYLGQHPKLFTSSIKEPHFFAYGEASFSFNGPGDSKAVHSSLSLPQYKNLFAPANPDQLCGEASASSLYVPRAAKRIEYYVPDARMIAILRNPVERAYSNYLLLARDGREPCESFQDALSREQERIRKNWEHGWHYLQLGFYHKQLTRFYDRFHPDQLHVCLFDNFVENTRSTVQNIFEFLNVDASFLPDTSLRHNPSGRPRFSTLHWILQLAGIGAKVRALLPDPFVETIARKGRPLVESLRRCKKYLVHRNLKRPPLSRAIRVQLQHIYREDILRLQGLIDRDLSHWLEEPPPSS